MFSFTKLIITLSCLFISLSSFAQAPDLEQFIARNVRPYMSMQNVPGVAIALYYNGQIHFFNFGVAEKRTNKRVNKDTIFELGSVTKVFTATLVAEQILARRMSLQDPVRKYFPNAFPNAPINRVTIQELATHTSSLPDIPPNIPVAFRPQYTKADMMRFFDNWRPQTPIGSTYSYSNIGFGLLGYILENATGKSYGQLLQTHIFNPLNMMNTSLNYAVDPSRYAQGYNRKNWPAIRWPIDAWPAGGALRSTTSDMAKFLKANLEVPMPQNPPQNLLNAMQFAQRPLFHAPKFDQGMAWAVRRDGILVKNGGTSGFSTVIALDPAQKMGIVILTNKSGVDPTRLAIQILSQLSGR